MTTRTWELWVEDGTTLRIDNDTMHVCPPITHVDEFCPPLRRRLTRIVIEVDE